MIRFTSAADRDLTRRIDDACITVETAKATWFDRSVELGRLLEEAKQHHPSVADFEAFLKQTKVGINLRWAYECIAMAGGPKEAERLRTANKERVKKHREKKRLNKSKPESERERKSERERQRAWGREQLHTAFADMERLRNLSDKREYVCKIALMLASPYDNEVVNAAHSLIRLFGDVHLLAKKLGEALDWDEHLRRMRARREAA